MPLQVHVVRRFDTALDITSYERYGEGMHGAVGDQWG